MRMLLENSEILDHCQQDRVQDAYALRCIPQIHGACRDALQFVQEKVEIDYVQKKQVKKPAGAKPGFVVYYTNYSMMIDSDISGLRQL